MHRGKTYPYLPEYWSTEAWFFPGFVPWKMWVESGGNLEGAWMNLPQDFVCVTDPGIPGPTYFNPLWEHLFYVSEDEVLLQIFLSKGYHAEVPIAQWDLRLWVNGLQVAGGRAAQSYPQFQVYVTDPELRRIDDEGNDLGPLDLLIRPATYAEGGSPWD